MAATSVIAMVLGGALLVLVLGAGVWALRHQRRQYPEGFDRTGWGGDAERAGWFQTKFTWLSGGRG